MGWSQVRVLPVSEDNVAQLAEHLRRRFRLLPDTEFRFAVALVRVTSLDEITPFRLFPASGLAWRR